ncbi:hypothetical protein D1012_07405 [Pseudotabrizicola alkalilacus]|uniref:Acyl-CoA dehydrogenase n=2 Tax=Pseudotabrizicola alkalilacus TaxID=2305252 RepID=A0A411Z3Y0_9RHOB|nr:hypothetical protein D1012_07405 [Pseudotabrizicola alkalilacus]
MAALSPTVSAHLIAASEIIHATARATVRATPSARQTLAHIDAAQSFMVAADALYEAAERVAQGAPLDAPQLRLALWVAAAKSAQGYAALRTDPLSASLPGIDSTLS